MIKLTIVATVLSILGCEGNTTYVTIPVPTMGDCIIAGRTVNGARNYNTKVYCEDSDEQILVEVKTPKKQDL